MGGVVRAGQSLAVGALKGIVRSGMHCTVKGLAREVLQAAIARLIQALTPQQFSITTALRDPQPAVAPQFALGAEAMGCLDIGGEAGRADQPYSWHRLEALHLGILPSLTAEQCPGVMLGLQGVI